MEFNFETIMAIIGLFLGAGGGGAFFTWRYQRKKAGAEAAKAWQEVYQQMIVDIKEDRNEQKEYINELKEDRQHLRRDRDDLRKRQDELDDIVRHLQKEVAHNTRMMECMRPFLCGRDGCQDRMPVTVSADGEVRKKRKEEVSVIEPLKKEEL